MSIIRKHVLIFPSIDYKIFPAITTKLGCEELHLFDSGEDTKKLWQSVANTIQTFFHDHEVKGSLEQMSSVIGQKVASMVDPNTLIAISIDSHRPILLMDAIWQAITEFTDLHKETDTKGRLTDPSTCILYSIDKKTNYLVTRPIYPFWDSRFQTVIKALQNFPDGGTKKKISSFLDSLGIPMTNDKLTRLLLPLTNWLSFFEGFSCESRQINLKRTNFYRLKEFHKYKLQQ